MGAEDLKRLRDFELRQNFKVKALLTSYLAGFSPLVMGDMTTPPCRVIVREKELPTNIKSVTAAQLSEVMVCICALGVDRVVER